MMQPSAIFDMGQEVEGQQGGLPAAWKHVVREVRRYLDSTNEIQTSSAEEQVARPPANAIPAPRLRTPNPVTPAPDRAARKIQWAMTSRGDGQQNLNKRKQRQDDNTRHVQPSLPTTSESNETAPKGRYLLQTPRFRHEFGKLSIEGQREILKAIAAIMVEKGEFHPLHDTGGPIKLFTGREHAGNGPDRRIICMPVKGEVQGVKEAYYMIAILPPGHDYGTNIINGLLDTANLILSGEQMKRIRELNPGVTFVI